MAQKMAQKISHASGRGRRPIRTIPQRKTTVTTSNNDRTRGDGAAKDEAAKAMMTDPAGGGASLDKVRDILFGVQMRDSERKLARLEERLVKETADLKDDVKKRLAALEQFIKKEAESLTDRIKAEHDERSDGLKDVARELKETGRTFEKKTASLDDQLAKGQRELRQQMLDQYQRLAEEIRLKTEEVLKRLAQDSQELRTEKTDRAALASLLTEMAMRLNNEFKIPGADDDRNG